MFHHILKTGCLAEDARLRTAERLVKLIAVFCILAWRVFWTNMVGRAPPGADPCLAVTAAEIALLDRLVPDRAAGGRTLSAYVVKVARLGRYLARSRDPPPGNLVMWRGLAEFAAIALGATFARASPRCG
jgi:Transposase Tn5 dimerisation domain